MFKRPKKHLGDGLIGSEEKWKAFEKIDEDRIGEYYKERRGMAPIKEIAEDMIGTRDFDIEDLQSRSRRRELSRL
ncbi:MAG: hypothetical protein ACQEQC_03475, partial [Elusimicrobiota bacterium]